MTIYTRLPDDSDLFAMLVAAKLFDGRETGALFEELHGYVDSAIDEFQERTGRKPFLIDQTDVARTFDPPGEDASPFATAARPFVANRGLDDPNPIFTSQKCGGQTFLLFDNGLLELSSVVAQITPQNPLGRTLTLGREFNLFPYNAAAKGEAWTGLEFTRPHWGLRRSVQVTGKWGYARNCPSRAFKGILAIAAYMAAPVIEQAVTKSQISYQDKTQKVQYDDDPVTGTASKWKELGQSAIALYMTEEMKWNGSAQASL